MYLRFSSSSRSQHFFRFFSFFSFLSFFFSPFFLPSSPQPSSALRFLSSSSHLPPPPLAPSLPDPLSPLLLLLLHVGSPRLLLFAGSPRPVASPPPPPRQIPSACCFSSTTPARVESLFPSSTAPRSETVGSPFPFLQRRPSPAIYFSLGYRSRRRPPRSSPSSRRRLPQPHPRKPPPSLSSLAIGSGHGPPDPAPPCLPSLRPAPRHLLTFLAHAWIRPWAAGSYSSSPSSLAPPHAVAPACPHATQPAAVRSCVTQLRRTMCNEATTTGRSTDTSWLQ